MQQVHGELHKQAGMWFTYCGGSSVALGKSLCLQLVTGVAVHCMCALCPILCFMCVGTTVCTLIFTGFNIHGFCRSAICEYLDVTVNGHVYTQLKPIEDVMRN